MFLLTFPFGRSYEFMVLSRNEAQGVRLLKKAWKDFAKSNGADPRYMLDNMDSMRVYELEIDEVQMV